MEHINVEANESFKHGFILTEQELRRFIDTITEQYKKVRSDAVIKIMYKIKFANGIVASTLNLDDIINQENSGSAQISRLELISEAIIESEHYNITVLFENIEDEKGTYPIKYKIVGRSRDWVFVTSSMISETIKKVKRNDFLFNFILGDNRLSGSFRSLGVMLTFMFGMVISLFNNLNKSSQRSSQLDKVEELWRKGVIKDPTDAIIRIERIRMTKELDLENPIYIFKPIMFIFIIIFAGYACLYMLNKYYPRYNFCWGDYLAYFDKIESKRKNIFWIVIVGLILSILGSIIATYVLNLKF